MLILILLIFGIGVYFYSYHCFDAPISPGFRTALTVCRFLFLGCVLYLITRPSLTQEQTLILYPDLYILLDDSQSMAQPIRPQLNQSGSQPSRWQTAIDKLQSAMLPYWRSQGYTLHFGLLSQVTERRQAEPPWQHSLPAWAEPAYPYTDLGAAVDRFYQTQNQNTPSYLLIVTDGQYNRGKNPLAAVRGQAESDGQSNGGGLSQSLEANEVKASYQEKRIYTFGIGTTLRMFDLLLDAIQAPNTVRAGDETPVNVFIRFHGDPPSEPISVTLELQDQAGTVIHSENRQLAPPTQGQELSTQFTLPSLQEGEYQYTLSIDPFPNELFEDNNAQTQGLRVRKAQDKILVLTSAPNWEFKFLKRALEDQETIAVEAFYLHKNGLSRLGDRTWHAQQTGENPPEPAAPDAEKIEDLQTHLASFSSLVLHNITLPPENLPFAEQIAQYVENGGGLLFLPGSLNTSSMPSNIREALPAAVAQRFSVIPSFIQVDPAAELLREILSDAPTQLPPLAPYYQYAERRFGGQVLLEGVLNSDQTVPVITLDRFGLGTIITAHTHSLWKWRLLLEEPFLNELWLKLLYQLNPSLTSQENHLYTDGFLYQVLEPVEVTYAAGPAVSQATPSGMAIEVRHHDERETLWLSNSGTQNLFRGRYTPTQPGDYYFSGPVESASASIRVEENPRERFDITQNVGLLRELAERTGGEYANAPAWENLAQRLPLSTKTIEHTQSYFLGEFWWYAAMLIAFLGFEWLLRWRKGLP